MKDSSSLCTLVIPLCNKHIFLKNTQNLLIVKAFNINTTTTTTTTAVLINLKLKKYSVRNLFYYIVGIQFFSVLSSIYPPDHNYQGVSKGRAF